MSVLTQNITRPQQALQSYLDDLLQEAFNDLDLAGGLDEFEQAVREEQMRDAASLQRAPARAAASVVAVPRPAPSITPVMRVAPPVLLEKKIVVEPTPLAAIQIEPAPALFNQRPAWAAEPFECLLFDVAGLTLAVPLVCLGTIHPLNTGELTPLFGQPDWFLGLLPTQSGNLRVLDTARWVLAERYRDDLREGLQYVISVQGYEWGLAVHQVSRSIRLDPQAVKWRDQRSQRPWLAGTVIEHMCALLDVTALAQLIVAGAGTDRAPAGNN